MPKKRDLNTIARLEQAITKKYGEKAVQHPRSNWDEDKEEEYLEQLKKLLEKEDKTKEKVEKVEKDGFLISKKLLNKESDRNCPVCEIYSFDIKDNMYMTKFSCCYLCYMEFVDQREERWNSGWRPSKDEIKKRRFNKDD
tara:strand:- start:155 stop:574 length:420 start_codon:yes stop_codon:yes gene_type:complete